MKNFITGVIVGLTISGVAWAASGYMKLQSADGNAITASNPLQVVAY